MSTSDITTKVFIVLGKPATFDKSGYETLFGPKANRAQIKGIVSVGKIGVTDALIDVPDLQSGFTAAIKGARAGTVFEIAMREIKTDTTGQGVAKTACAAFVEYSLGIEEPTGTGNIEYVTGLPHDWQRNERSTAAYAGFTMNFRTNYPSVVVAAPTT